MLEIRRLRSAYGRIEVLHGLDLDVQKGEIVCLIGGNGAGKTTLLRAISGVQPVTGGSLMFEGRDITSLPAEKRVALGIAQVPEGRQIFGGLTVEDNLNLGGWLHGGGTARERDDIYTLFPILHEKRALQAGGLSGGQQQMLAIGRALMSRPRLLLLDEPSMGLAPVLVEQVFGVIESLQQRGITILLVEQNAAAALAKSDRGFVIETGHITHSGASADLIGDPKLREAYLGH
ncbi:MAG: ABC transporter ATP-binding protein [Methylobacterium sp.]|nr:ABC transporter ATP-binding protein [Methylobacterium sp.]MCA3603565.1 ABC transporter ATP-binding protein [Methylobacterium sp.]MCA3614389.1 ABC transporter ATP-binding protein [Methylobacterium sp.]MCA3628589.1 ABC transporter ATP-binding protein [Methylobacterium sp.]MCA4909005.1 ABC transporter ATP-binding protein [Methylobacterium sp.]